MNHASVGTTRRWSARHLAATAWFVAVGVVLACTPQSPAPPAASTGPAPSAIRQPARVPTDRPARGPYRTDAALNQVDVDGHAIAVWHKPTLPGHSPPPQEGAVGPLPPVLLLHGRTWSGLPDFDLQVRGEQRSLMDELRRHGLPPYAMDMRGYGATVRDETGWLTPDRAAADVAGVLAWMAARHGGRAPVLLGWSLGSMVAQLVAQRQPASISALVLYGYPHDPSYTFPPSGVGPDKPARQATTRAAAASDFIVAGATTPATVEAYVDACVRSDPVRMDWRGASQWNELDPAAVSVDTLLVHGEHDPYAPRAVQVRVLEALGSSRRQHVVMRGGDHAAHLEDAKPTLADALRVFVTAR